MSHYFVRAIDYVNAPPHVGHALEYIVIDVLARYQKSLGESVRVGVGTDEHGQKIAQSAKEAGMLPQEYCDINAHHFKNLASQLGVQYDTFTRTSDPDHKRRCQTAWNIVMEKGDIYKKKYAGLYCVGCESFKQEKDLEHGACPFHDTPLQPIEEENYFFALSKYTEAIRSWLAENPNIIFPEERFNEIMSLLDEGLEDISISRSSQVLSWGIPVPNDETQVMYVWFDALLNYITALGYPEDFETQALWWEYSEVTHIIGKDILRHHAAIWPGMLLSLGVKLPDHYFVHGFITSGGRKMSKSLGNVIDPIELLTRYGADALRWYLIKEMPAGKDGDITWERFHDIYHADLANGLGNLHRRVLTLMEKYACKTPQKTDTFEGKLLRWDASYHEALQSYKLHEACFLLMEMIQEANQYINIHAPWEKAKIDLAGAQSDLWSLWHILDSIVDKISIFLPHTAPTLRRQLDDIQAGEILYPRID